MSRLEDLKESASVRGILPNELVTVVSASGMALPPWTSRIRRPKEAGS